MAPRDTQMVPNIASYSCRCRTFASAIFAIFGDGYVAYGDWDWIAVSLICWHMMLVSADDCSLV